MAKYVNVKRKDGRTQRAMVLASGRYKFVKNTAGRTSAPKKRKGTMAKRRNRKSTALTHRKRSYHPKKRYARRRRGGGGMSRGALIPIALGAAALAYITGPSGPAQVRNTAMKIPGAKTFGPLAVAGGACLAIDRFVKPNKWLKIAGLVGVVAAAVKVGEQGQNFKWVGDDDIGDYDLQDLEGDDDLGDDDVGDDDLGDDDLADANDD